jgi:hypothetical protein
VAEARAALPPAQFLRQLSALPDPVTTAGNKNNQELEEINGQLQPFLHILSTGVQGLAETAELESIQSAVSILAVGTRLMEGTDHTVHGLATMLVSTFHCDWGGGKAGGIHPTLKLCLPSVCPSVRSCEIAQWCL